MTTIDELRAKVRKDLHDEDSGSYRWSDAELDRHLLHAVRDFSLAAPAQQKTALQATDAGREVDISGLTDLVKVYNVEFPTDGYPRSFVEYQVWNATIFLYIDEEPAAGEDLNVYWGKVHTLDASGSTIPAQYEEVVAVGASAYAALEWASYATNRVNIGGTWTWRNYLQWGQARLAEFQRSLKEIDRKMRVRQVRAR